MPVIVSLLLSCSIDTYLLKIVTTGKVLDVSQLAEVHGRAWDDVDH